MVNELSLFLNRIRVHIILLNRRCGSAYILIIYEFILHGYIVGVAQLIIYLVGEV